MSAILSSLAETKLTEVEIASRENQETSNDALIAKLLQAKERLEHERQTEQRKEEEKQRLEQDASLAASLAEHESRSSGASQINTPMMWSQLGREVGSGAGTENRWAQHGRKGTGGGGSMNAARALKLESLCSLFPGKRCFSFL